MKILLINLPTESKVKDFTTADYMLTDFMRYPPLGLLAIATEVKKRHSVKVMDVANNMSIEAVIEYVLKYQPDLLGISVVTRYLYAMHEISRRVKKGNPEIKIAVGGPHINYFPMETMQLGFVDYALPGYGEKTFPRLVEAVDSANAQDFSSIPNLYYKFQDGHIHRAPAVEEPLMLDDLPFPDRSLVNLNDYYTAADKVRMTTLYSSRGCPFQCIFCDVQDKKFHFRSAKRLVDEFQEIMGLGIKEIHIFDDTFNVSKQRVIDICEEIIKRKLKIRWSSRARVFPFDKDLAGLMKKAGCERLHVGVESLDPQILKFMKKGITLEQVQSFFKLCNDFRIETLAYFIIGFPNETEEYRRRLFNEARKLKPSYVYFNILYPLPKTEYYNSLLKDGTYKKDYWAEFVSNPTDNFEVPLPRGQELQDRLKEIADNYHRRFFLSPGFIIRETKKSLFTPSMLFLKIKIAILLVIKTKFKKSISKNKAGKRA